MLRETQFSSGTTLNRDTLSRIDQSCQRRTANYKPNIWKYDHIQAINRLYAEEKYKWKAQKLKEEVARTFAIAKNLASKLELTDCVYKLGLATYFEEEIREALDSVALLPAEKRISIMEGDLHTTALCFRLLRKYGYSASQDMFRGFLDENGKFMANTDSNFDALLELFEASNMGSEQEDTLNEAGLFSIRCLEEYVANSDCSIAKDAVEVLSLPLHWRPEWYDIKKNIHVYEKDYEDKSPLIELAKLNFNIIQAAQQEDLKEIARWWMNLGIADKMSFSRDRMVESFMYSGGVATEPQYGSLRKWLSKVIKLMLIIDDFYIYGFLDELECFTNAVDRWKLDELQNSAECMEICFGALSNTTGEIAAEIQKQKGWSLVLPFLQKAWSDFCKSLLLEAKWHSNGYTPSLQEYVDNGWISSSGPLISLHHIILGVANPKLKDVPEFVKDSQDIIYSTSLIIRLLNDLGTSVAELERGDAPSSILCYMREENVSEEAVREHIRNKIVRTWRKINSYCISTASFQQEPVKFIINAARVAHYIYQHGDGFGVQDHETRMQLVQLTSVLAHFVFEQETIHLFTDIS